VAGGFDVSQAVRDADDGLAAFGHATEEFHDVTICLFVQTGGDLVEKQQTGAGDQLVGEA
jgi:hypothetical protein